MNERALEEIRQALQEANRILLVTHVRPDGDAIGALLGLGLALQASGKTVQMILPEKLPSGFRHLPGSDQVSVQAEGAFDLAVILDCSDLGRVGDALLVRNGSNEKTAHAPDINIDHHITNTFFGRFNLIESEAAATSEILARNLAALGLSLTKPVAETLLTGILTDTLGFRTSNMKPGVLRLAADLMEAGANLPELYNAALNSKSFTAARYWGAGLSQLQRDGSIAWATLSLSDRRLVGYPGRDDADLINVVSSIEEAEVALVFVEQDHDTVKVSWRSRPGFDVSQVASGFGGGGHKAAAGAEIPGGLPEVQAKVLAATRALFV